MTSPTESHADLISIRLDSSRTRSTDVSRECSQCSIGDLCDFIISCATVINRRWWLTGSDVIGMLETFKNAAILLPSKSIQE